MNLSDFKSKYYYRSENRGGLDMFLDMLTNSQKINIPHSHLHSNDLSGQQAFRLRPHSDERTR